MNWRGGRIPSGERKHSKKIASGSRGGVTGALGVENPGGGD